MTIKIPKENILVDLNVANKEEAIQQLADLITKNGYILDKKQYIAAVYDREAHMTTGIGKGIAIPHGKDDSVKESTVAMATLQQTIDWASLDDQPVEMVFLLAIAEKDKGNEHLRVLADLSEKLMDDDFVVAVKNADTVEKIEKIMQDN